MNRNTTQLQQETLPESSMGMSLGNCTEQSRSAVYLGIDPGLQRTGYAILKRTPHKPMLVEGGVIKSSSSQTLAERVLEIGQGIQEVIAEYHPEAVAIEQVFSMTRNPKTAVLMAHARGAILFAAAQAELPIMHYTPRQIKKLLTGHGAASKEQVQAAIKRELGLKQILEPNDVADASAVALCHYHSCQVDLNHANACTA